MGWLTRFRWSKEERIALIAGLAVLLILLLVFSGWIVLSVIQSAYDKPWGGIGDAYVWVTRKADQESFTFWGKVVDHNGHPIEDAVVTIRLNAMDQEDYFVTTDTQGMFEFSDQGTMLGIMNIEGDGHFFYDRRPMKEIANVHNASTCSFDFKRGGYHQTYLPDESNPAIFVLVQTGEPINIWPSRGGSDLNGGTGQIYSNAPLRPLEPSVEIIDTPNGPVAGDPIPRWAPYSKR